MPDCQHCSAPSQLFLCTRCQSELRAKLQRLAHGDTVNNGHKTYASGNFLEYLHDKAYGKTREGQSERRSTERNSPMPVNLAASQLLDTVKDTLHRWAQKILIQGGC